MNKIVYGFDSVGGRAVMAVHCFSIAGNGNLLHEIDGKIRAEVPPEGFEAYAEQWPECQSVLTGRVFAADIDPLKPFVAALAEEIKANPSDNQSQIDYLTAELAKLTVLPDNTDSGSPAS